MSASGLLLAITVTLVVAVLFALASESLRKGEKRLKRRARSVAQFAHALRALEEHLADPQGGERRSEAFAKMCAARLGLLRFLYPAVPPIAFAVARRQRPEQDLVPLRRVGEVAQELIVGNLRERLLTETPRKLEPVAPETCELLRSGYAAVFQQTRLREQSPRDLADALVDLLAPHGVLVKGKLCLLPVFLPPDREHECPVSPRFQELFAPSALEARGIAGNEPRGPAEDRDILLGLRQQLREYYAYCADTVIRVSTRKAKSVDASGRGGPEARGPSRALPEHVDVQPVSRRLWVACLFLRHTVGCIARSPFFGVHEPPGDRLHTEFREAYSAYFEGAVEYIDGGIGNQDFLETTAEYLCKLHHLLMTPCPEARLPRPLARWLPDRPAARAVVGHARVLWDVLVQFLRVQLAVPLANSWANRQNQAQIQDRLSGGNGDPGPWGKSSLSEAMHVKPDPEDPRRDEVNQWNVLRLSGWLDPVLLADMLVRVHRAVGADPFTRVVGIARDGVALATVLALWYDRPLSILSVSPFVAMSPKADPQDVLILADSTRITGGTLRMARDRFSYYWPEHVALPARAVVCALCRRPPMRFERTVRTKSLLELPRVNSTRGHDCDWWDGQIAFQPTRTQMAHALASAFVADIGETPLDALRDALKKALLTPPVKENLDPQDGREFMLHRGQVWNNMDLLRRIGYYLGSAHLADWLSRDSSDPVLIIMGSRNAVPLATAAGLFACASPTVKTRTFDPLTAEADALPDLRFTLARSLGDYVPFLRKYITGASRVVVVDTFIKEGDVATQLMREIANAWPDKRTKPDVPNVVFFCLAAYKHGYRRTAAVARRYEYLKVDFDILTQERHCPFEE